MTSQDDTRLRGRHPEFARMSNRPGIGANFMHYAASAMLEFNLEQNAGDVPSHLRHGKKLLPLGRYLRRKLRTYVGLPEETPQQILQKLFEEMQPLRDLAQAASDETGEKYSKAFKRIAMEQSEQQVRTMEARIKIFKDRRHL